MKKTLFLILGAGLFLVLLFWLAMGDNRKRVEVCVTFNGRTECRTASGSTEAEAQRTAIQNACALLASGMTDSIACDRSAPTRVRILQ